VIRSAVSGDGPRVVSALSPTSPAAAVPPALAVGAARDLGALVTAHHAFTFRVLRRLGLGPADADDATQQVFVVFARRLADVEPGKERAFLYRTAAHVASRFHRSRRRRPEELRDEPPEPPDEGPSPDELVERRRARALLDELLAALPPDLRAVLILFELESLTTAEVAEALDVPSGTVASRLRRARAELDTALHARLRPTPRGAPP